MENLKKVLKHSLFFLIGFMVLSHFLNSCENPNDSVNINDPNRLSPSNFWKTNDDAEKGIVGVYGPLTTIYGWGRMMGALLTIDRSDIVDPYPQPGVSNAGTFNNLVPTNAIVADGWGSLSRIVARANQVLAHVPDIDMNADRKKQIVGEAYFLRGLAHFYLLNMWGHIPLITKPITNPENLNVEQAPQKEVWKSIKSDFIEAQSRLPKTWPESDTGRATWGAATSMLGKSHLYTQNWSKAATELKKVIDSGLYELVGNYQWNFLASHNNNKESIFELQYERSTNGNWGTSGTRNPWRGQAWEPDLAPHGYTSQQSVDVNQWVFDLFMKQKTNTGDIDPRAYATILWNYPDAKVYQDDFDKAFKGKNLNKIWVRKYLNFNRTSSLTPGSWAYSNNNYRMIRFADVLLMYAEAENEANGPSSNIYNAVNRVRQRVNMPNIITGLDQAGMRSAIRKERVLELGIEENRFFDLKRWGIAYDRFNNHPEFRENSGGTLDEGEIYLPIPQNDIDANPKLKQNPGYN